MRAITGGAINAKTTSSIVTGALIAVTWASTNAAATKNAYFTNQTNPAGPMLAERQPSANRRRSGASASEASSACIASPHSCRS